MKRSLRIIVLVHEQLVPPDSIDGLSDEELTPMKTEFDVVATLRESGHTVLPVGVSHELQPLLDVMERFKPDIVFNLLEEFCGIGVFDTHVVSLLELLRVPYTGCNPRGLMLSHNKALSKTVLRHHRVRVPRFFVTPVGRKARRPSKLDFPLIVKSLTEEGSIGIAQASVVYDDATLADRVEFIHRQTGTDAIAEQYIDGREIYVALLGNERLQTFTPWEMFFEKLREDAPRIATGRIKWDLRYRQSIGIDTGPAKDISEQLKRRIASTSRRAYRGLMLSGYARLDFRLTPDDRLYLLEANPNPDLSYGEDYAESAETCGIDYNQLLQRIINHGLRYKLLGQG